jgi:hypothetical protein
MVNMLAEARSVLVVVIEADNLERMKKADPITLESFLQGGGLKPPMFPLNMSVLIAYEDDQPKLYELAREGHTPEGTKALFDYLERGRVFIEGKDGLENFTRP